MEAPMLPTVRLPSVDGGESVSSDCVNKFSLSWSPATRTASTPPASERVALNFTEADSESSDGDSGDERQEQEVVDPDEGGRTKAPPVVRMSGTARSGQPRLSRALTMPLPSQLRYLRNPRRSDTSTHTDEHASMSNLYQLNELSTELADSVQTMVETMLQISPPQLLDPAKEQLSACSLSVPMSAMSAMLTLIKNLNYMSANMNGLCSAPQSAEDDGVCPPSQSQLSDFDIGELLQNVGDSLSGVAAKAEVDLVLYHGDDTGLRHVCVKGAESGIAYALSHVVRQIIATAQPGDTIELGLLFGAISTDDDRLPPESVDPLSCTIRMSHKFCVTSTVPRPQPCFSTLLLRRILRQIGATLTPDLPPPKSFTEGRTCDFVLALDRGSLSVLNTPAAGQHDDEPTSGEPSVDQLIMFAEGLKGKRVTLYANAKGSFAQHLTSYLTAWGMEIAHVSPDGEVDGLPNCPPSPTPHVLPPSGLPRTYGKSDSPTSPTSSKDQPSFIFIDDDIEVLKQRLHALRADKPYPLNLTLRKRPSLASHHRTRSSPQVNRAIAPPPISSSPVLVHFTSIGNYKLIKDVIQSITSYHTASSIPLPEVMVIPKPAGPRRFLTALYTAVTKPVVDPFFTPIATTPTSPIVYTNGSFFHTYSGSAEPKSPRSSPKPRPSGSRTNSDRSSKSTKDIAEINASHLPPPSPLSISDNVEYFSEAAAKLGASPSSGLMIQSPDGQPAGIFFSPRVKSPRNPSAQSMERDKGQLNVPEQKRRSSRLSVHSNEPNGTISFSALHTMAATSPTRSSDTHTHAPHKHSRTPTPGSRTFSQRSSTSHEDENGSGGATSAVRRPSASAGAGAGAEGHKATPPGSPQPDGGNGAVAKRGTPRRLSQQESASPSSAASTALAAANRKVTAAADGNIVPPISVLIVDDNPINQTILSTFMKKKKIKYDLANNGQDAVTKFRTGDFHLILMDIQMPIMDGIQATKEIRRLEQVNAAVAYPAGTPFDDNPTPSDSSTENKYSASPYRSSVIIVALTASSLQSDRVAALAAGCNDFLTKPVSLIWLNSKIIEWGSLKALQMWADHRPSEAIKNMSNAQAAQAQNVADRLHVPPGRSTPSPSRQVVVPNARTPPPIAVSTNPPGHSTSPSGLGHGVPISPTSPTARNHDRTQTPYWSQLGTSSSPSSANSIEEQIKDLPIITRRRSSAAHTSLSGIAASIHASEASSSSSTKPAAQAEQEQDDDSRGKYPSASRQAPR
ncbi:hypothetical protein C0995_012863 [Termitomyces sp. Mi166|nr:hypothetical protein C0995_012863 [Termitomyces sp. Mi166\